MKPASFLHPIRQFFRTVGRLRQVTSDAADILSFRSKCVSAVIEGSDTWNAALALLGVAAYLTLVSEKIPVAIAAILAAICIGVLVGWGKVSTIDAKKAYLGAAAGAFVMFFTILLPRYEMVLAAWFILAYLLAIRPAANA